MVPCEVGLCFRARLGYVYTYIFFYPLIDCCRRNREERVRRRYCCSRRRREGCRRWGITCSIHYRKTSVRVRSQGANAKAKYFLWCLPLFCLKSTLNDLRTSFSHSPSISVNGRVPTRPGKPGKMRVHLENLEIWNFEKINKNHGKMTWNLEKLGGY